MRLKIIVLLFLVFNMHTPRNIQGGYVAADFWTQWGSTTPRMALFIKVTSKAEFGSEVLAFTTNTRDMTLPGHVGVTFKSSPGMTPTVIEQSLDEPANMEMTGVYNADSFTQTDVLSGKWNFAAIEVFSASWQNTSLGELVHFKGNLGDFKDYQTYFTAEARGLTARLSNDVNWVTSRTCRSPYFRDPVYCKHTASTVTIDGVVYPVVLTGVAGSDAGNDNVSEIQIFDIEFATLPADGIYANGKITATSGANSGVSRELTGNVHYPLLDSSLFTLKRAFPFAVEADTTFTIVLGCDKTIEHCMRYENIVNRRAEDYIPGLEAITRLPTTGGGG